MGWGVEVGNKKPTCQGRCSFRSKIEADSTQIKEVPLWTEKYGPIGFHINTPTVLTFPSISASSNTMTTNCLSVHSSQNATHVATSLLHIHIRNYDAVQPTPEPHETWSHHRMRVLKTDCSRPGRFWGGRFHRVLCPYATASRQKNRRIVNAT